MRQGRYKYRREKASREAEKAAADSIKYGIATVDWEARRAEAHRALHDQVDDYSPTTSIWMEPSGQGVEGVASEQVDWTYAEVPTEDKKSEASAYDNAMPFVKSEGGFESIPLDATAVPPGNHACAQATSPESTRRKKRATCPGSFPESRSGSLKEKITM